MSTLPQGGFQERRKTGRRKAVVWGALLFLFLAVWSAVVLSWGGPQEAGGSGGDAPRGGASEARGSAGAGGREAVPGSTAHARGEHSEGDPIGGAAGGAQTGGEPPGREAPPTGRDAPTGAAGGRPAPAGFRPDPLGTGASEGDLAPVDRQRVSYAAARFVTAAYGYSGHDENAYNQAVGETVAWPVFYESPGSKEIGRFAAQVKETGTKSAALLTRFELTGASGSEASGWAYFRTGEGYGESGGLTGEKLSYRQKMTLVRSGGAWIVKATEPIEET